MSPTLLKKKKGFFGKYRRGNHLEGAVALWSNQVKYFPAELANFVKGLTRVNNNSPKMLNTTLALKLVSQHSRRTL